MFENVHCSNCSLHAAANLVCMPSQGDETCSLAILLDQPTMVEDKRKKSFVSESADFVKYCLRRMGIDPDTVYLDYIVKCYGKLPTKKDERNVLVNACEYKLAALQTFKSLKAVVVLGKVGCEWVTGGSILGDWAGADWPLARNHTMHCIIPKVWVGYSPGYAMEKPSESGGIFRVIWKAAEEAGLKPSVTKIPAFPFNI